MAAVLSFLWPGLGQLYAGRRRQAAAFAVPAIVAILLVLYQARQGIDVLVARFVDPGFAMAALLVVLAVGAIRIASVVHAYLVVVHGATPSGGARRTGRTVVAVLVALIVATHGLAGAVAYLDYNAFSQVFSGSLLPGDIGAPDPAAPSETPPPDLYLGGSPPPASFGPTETPRVIAGRVTILLTGVDWEVGRSEHLYDTIMVVSLDSNTNKVAMVSVPRDSAAFPLYFGGTVGPTIRINALAHYVQRGWIKSPDDPMTTFVREIGYLVGIPIDYYAVIDLAGFQKMVDTVGGIDIVNPVAVDDPGYAWEDGSPAGFELSAGPHHLTGKTALAYVRSRHGFNNSDWKRASRQQLVMVALERKMASPGMLVQLPTLMQTLGSSVRTTFPAARVADMVALGGQVPPSNIDQVVLGPPYSDIGTGARWGVSTNCLRLDRIAALSVKLFGQDSRYSGHNQADTCPA